MEFGISKGIRAPDLLGVNETSTTAPSAQQFLNQRLAREALAAKNLAPNFPPSPHPIGVKNHSVAAKLQAMF